MPYWLWSDANVPSNASRAAWVRRAEFIHSAAAHWTERVRMNSHLRKAGNGREVRRAEFTHSAAAHWTERVRMNSHLRKAGNGREVRRAEFIRPRPRFVCDGGFV